MMIPFTGRMGVTFAAAMVVGAALSMVPAPAISADRSQLAQTSPPQSAPTPPSAAQPTPAKRTPVNRVEARIKSLHDQLKITAAQEPQWSDVAQVMRDNAKAMSDLILDRAKNLKTMTAIDDLHSYQALAETHAAGVKKLVPVFETLYGTMSDAQKKKADAVFSHRPRRAHR
jgi:protein CpxP